MIGETEVWAPPVVISLDTALPLYQSEAPLQEFGFIVPRSPSSGRCRRRTDMAGWVLSVEVSSEEAAVILSNWLKGLSVVTEVTDHGAPGHCCCKNCPWNGDHELCTPPMMTSPTSNG